MKAPMMSSKTTWRTHKQVLVLDDPNKTIFMEWSAQKSVVVRIIIVNRDRAFESDWEPP